jgi:hypothetical protein
VFLVNSPLISLAAPQLLGEALSRNYGRYFAEFLNEDSLVHLGLLALPTCVGFSTVTVTLALEVFLGNSAA